MYELQQRIPVIKLWGVLLVPLQGDVTDRQVADLVQEVLGQIRRDGSRGLAVDLSGLNMVDSHLCAAFTELALAAGYMGARTILCGLSADIAMTLQTMGVELRGVEVALSLEQALAALGLRPTRTMDEELTDGRSLADAMLTRNPVGPESGLGGS